MKRKNRKEEKSKEEKRRDENSRKNLQKFSHINVFHFIPTLQHLRMNAGVRD